MNKFLILSAMLFLTACGCEEWSADLVCAGKGNPTKQVKFADNTTSYARYYFLWNGSHLWIKDGRVVAPVQWRDMEKKNG